MAIVVIPFILAYSMWRTGIWMPAGTTNQGTLMLPPLHVDELGLEDWSGSSMDYQDAQGLWTLIMVGDGSCGERCENALYLTRQVHIALGKDASRVQRYYAELASSMDEKLAASLAEQHPRLVTVHLDRARFVEYINAMANAQDLGFNAQTLVDDSYVFVADPLGNIMLYFTSGNTGKEILKDLKKLLKNSKVG